MDHLLIAKITVKHIIPAVKIHMAAFPGFFLTFLGAGFLKEFYTAFMADSLSIGFVAEDIKKNKILGVVAGSISPSSYFKRLLVRRWWAFCLASMKAFFEKPSIAPRLWRAVFYRGIPPALKQAEGLALLSIIAVSPDIQSKGVGKALLNAFIKEVKRRGGKGVYLTTDAENNDRAIRFYENLGFTIESSFTTPEGRKMLTYILVV